MTVYGDFNPDGFPLLLWLLASEICEHVFGLCRRMIKDFHALDFCFMVPKLMLQLRDLVARSHEDTQRSQVAGETFEFEEKGRESD